MMAMKIKNAVIAATCIRLGVLIFCSSLFIVRYMRSGLGLEDSAILNGRNAILTAVDHNDPVKLRELMRKQGFHPDGADSSGNMPLHIAIQIADTDTAMTMIDLILSAGYPAELTNVENHNKERPIHRVSYIQNACNRKKVIFKLLINGASLDSTDDKGHTILETFVAQRSLDNIKDFMHCFGWALSDDTLQQGKELAGSHAGTGLGLDSIYNFLSTPKAWMPNKDQSIIDQCCQFDPVTRAIIMGDNQEIERLVKGNKDFANAKTACGLRPVSLAILSGKISILRQLLTFGASIVYGEENDETPFHLIMESCHSQDSKIKMLELFRSAAGPKTQLIANFIPNKNTDTPLHCVARSGQDKIIDYLVKNFGNTDINWGKQNSEGYTAADVARIGLHKTAFTLLNKLSYLMR